MKHRLSRAEDVVRSAVDRLRIWFDPPLESDARPLEIREAIVEDIERLAEPAGHGRRVMPYTHFSVTVLAAQKHDRLRLKAALSDIEDVLRVRLRELRCSVPAEFSMTVKYARRAPPDWRPNQHLSIVYDSREQGPADTARRKELPKLRVAVVRGEATRSSYTFAGRNVRIGRGAKPVDARGQPRLNDVVFTEEGDAHTQTVGRAHASIRYEPARREYRIFDDGSQNGTRILREGMILDVIRRDLVGVTVKSGDEIQLGTAAIRVVITDY